MEGDGRVVARALPLVERLAPSCLGVRVARGRFRKLEVEARGRARSKEGFARRDLDEAGLLRADRAVGGAEARSSVVGDLAVAGCDVAKGPVRAEDVVEFAADVVGPVDGDDGDDAPAVEEGFDGSPADEVLVGDVVVREDLRGRELSGASRRVEEPRGTLGKDARPSTPGRRARARASARISSKTAGVSGAETPGATDGDDAPSSRSV